MNLRVVESLWAPFVKALCARRDVESAGVILAERLNGDVLLARQLFLVPNEGYAIRRADRLRIDAITLNRMIRPARDAGLSVITVHTHPGASRPWFSAADDAGDARLIPSLLVQTAGPHGSAVVAGDTGLPRVRVWSTIEHKTGVDVRIVGRRLQSVSFDGEEAETTSWFQRQRLALGREGQKVLKRLHVAVVGLGGVGSVAFVQLAHLGIGRITVIDGDLVEPSNVSRILGVTVADVGRVLKVDVAARYARQLGLGTHVSVLPGHLGLQVSARDLEGCDAALSCVDRHAPRALLNRLSYERAIPVIDLGGAFRVGADGRITAGAGRVVVVGPERRCLACWGHIDPHRIRTEALSAADRAREVADGYIEGADVPEPSVVAFNTAVAGAGVIEFLRLVTHFAGSDDPPGRLSFDFVTGVVRRNVLAATDACAICSPRSVQAVAS